MKEQIGNLVKTTVKKIKAEVVLRGPNLALGINVPHFRSEIGGSPQDVAIATAVVTGLCLLLCGTIAAAGLLSGGK